MPLCPRFSMDRKDPTPGGIAPDKLHEAVVDGLVRVREIVVHRGPVGVHGGSVRQHGSPCMQDGLGCGRHHLRRDLIGGPVLRTGHGGLPTVPRPAPASAMALLMLGRLPPMQVSSTSTGPENRPLPYRILFRVLRPRRESLIVNQWATWVSSRITQVPLGPRNRHPRCPGRT